uniref:Uncharacterized protein n=1 Tax=Micrurus spixii TaxID=129469 RepID=A0A2D4M6Q1_9SAUR
MGLWLLGVGLVCSVLLAIFGGFRVARFQEPPALKFLGFAFKKSPDGGAARSIEVSLVKYLSALATFQMGGLQLPEFHKPAHLKSQERLKKHCSNPKYLALNGISPSGFQSLHKINSI